MILKRHITPLLILLMLGMQGLLAQHYATHLSGGRYHVTAHHQLQGDGSSGKHQHGGTDPERVCQMCFFANSLSHAMAAAVIIIPAVLLIATAPQLILQAVLLPCTLQVYSARAPPPFS